MDLEQYKELKKAALKRYEQEIWEITARCCKENAKADIGDIVRDTISDTIILVDNLSPYGSVLEGLPEMKYTGKVLKKNLEPRSDNKRDTTWNHRMEVIKKQE